MLFSSITFLYYFLPVVLFLYYILPDSWKNIWLLTASLFFYGWGEPVFLLWMAVAILTAFTAGIFIERYKGSRTGKILFLISVICSVLYIGVFKYADFFVDSVNKIGGLSLTLPGIALPIGISFYTFQLLSYLIDVYRGDTKARKDLISFALYISMFPQLIAGPIVRYTVIEKQLDKRAHTYLNIGEGMGRFVIGLSKKVLIANPLGELAVIVKSSSDLSVLYIWLYAIALSFQIYFDFSGYSDMAIGLGRMFGFHFSENFNYPFISKSISEFWRRWHISLGTWFRDYVYIPLGGNRVTKARFCVNLFIVWFLTGFWHGAGWNFILWGLYYGVLLAVEKFWLHKYLKKNSILQYGYVWIFTIIGFLIFDCTDFSSVVFYLKAMCGLSGLPFVTAECLYYIKHYGILLVVAVAASLPAGKNLYLRVKEKTMQGKFLEYGEAFVLIGFMILITAYLIDGSFNPFLYFRF